MLFQVYSRYVPNMTRRDGSAIDRLLATRFATGNGVTKDSEGTAGTTVDAAGNAPRAAASEAGHSAQPPPVRQAA